MFCLREITIRYIKRSIQVSIIAQFIRKSSKKFVFFKYFMQITKFLLFLSHYVICITKMEVLCIAKAACENYNYAKKKCS